MPELPEVETVKNVLSNIVIGNTITSIDVYRERQIEGDVEIFKNALKGQTFLSLSRIGKYLIFHLTNDLVIISHLRMEGKYFEYLETEPDSKYARVVFHFANGHKLCYDDSRTFGVLKLTDEAHYLKDKGIAKLGPEPWDCDINIIYKKCRKVNTAIKTALLDQTLMTGLGNIYVDETLYASHIHPHTPAKLITLNEWQVIKDNASRILRRAIELGGSTIKSYHPGKDIDGNFQTEIKIYGRKGHICPICGHTYLFTKTNGRGTTYCPGCQHKLGSPINLGLTGSIGSGKSTVLDLFKAKGCEIISSDEIVKELYKEEKVINKINKMFKLNFTDEVDKKILRDYLLTHMKDKKRLENLVHPLVKKEIIKRMNASKSEIRVIEVPLLFKAHYEDIFTTLLVVESSEEVTLKRLEKRNGNIAPLLKEINKDNEIEENKNKAEFLVSNNGSLTELKQSVNQIFNILKSRLD
ncbi:MAG: DNA-formamidopyrimidine glycosylase [Lachnospira sp.]|nr:DNA-formamidopyrimidine glycosylase [Lachnospira sp.]